jgi:hypothetical protein
MIHPLFELLTKLEQSKISFTLNRCRPDTILVSLTVVGQRIEIDVFEDGHMEVSKFVGNEDIIGGEELINQIIQKNAD